MKYVQKFKLIFFSTCTFRPREGDVPFEASSLGGPVPILAPPPKSPAQAYTDTSPRFNPFDKSASYAEAAFGAEPEIPTLGL